MRKLALPLPALLLLVLGFAACGGGESDEEAIVNAIDYVFVSTDPDACTEQMTRVFSEQMFRHDGPEAVESCEQNARAEESPNRPVTVRKVKVDGSRATAELGTAYAEPFTVALVEEDGDWKLDEMVGYARFDKGDWLRREREAGEEVYSQSEQPILDCILAAYREMSRAEIEEIAFGGLSQTEFYADCAEARK